MLYKKLKVWHKSIDLVSDIYKLTEKYPKDERFGLVSQMRRSSVSIPSNISEGHARKSNKSFLNFLNISRGSLAELETQLFVSQKLNFITKEVLDKNQKTIDEVDKMICGLIKRLD